MPMNDNDISMHATYVRQSTGTIERIRAGRSGVPPKTRDRGSKIERKRKEKASHL